MSLSNDDVRDILRLLETTQFDELHLRTERFRLSLRRTPDGEWTQETQATTSPTVEPAVEPTVEPAEASAEASADEPADEQAEAPTAGRAGGTEVRAPLLGTFYRAPKPGAPPFVEVGSHVEEDAVVAIIETMKLMNSVYSGVRGTVVQIYPADAQFVEQGAVLMRVAPDDG